MPEVFTENDFAPSKTFTEEDFGDGLTFTESDFKSVPITDIPPMTQPSPEIKASGRRGESIDVNGQRATDLRAGIDQPKLPETPLEVVAEQNIGKTLGDAGKGWKAAGFDVAEAAIGDPDYGENVEAFKRGKEMPLEKETENLPTKQKVVARIGQQLLESAPRVAAVTAAQAVGVPATAGAAVAFGYDDEGKFSAKNAVVAAALPFVGKFGGVIAKRIATKFGVTSEVGLQAAKTVGNLGAPAIGLIADGEAELFANKNLKPEQRTSARIDLYANVIGMSVLGLTGEHGKLEDVAPKSADAKTSSVVEPSETELEYGEHGEIPKYNETFPIPEKQFVDESKLSEVRGGTTVGEKPQPRVNEAGAAEETPMMAGESSAGGQPPSPAPTREQDISRFNELEKRELALGRSDLMGENPEIQAKLQAVQREKQDIKERYEGHKPYDQEAVSPEPKISPETKPLTPRQQRLQEKNQQTADATEFNQLFEKHGVDLDLIRTPEAYFAPREPGGDTASIHHNIRVDRHKASVRAAAIKELNDGKPLPNNAETKAKLLPKLKERIAQLQQSDNLDPPENVSTEFLSKEERTPKLRAGEKRGDVFSNQTETLTLAGEKGTDSERIAAEKAKAEKDAAEAKLIQDKQQQEMFVKNFGTTTTGKPSGETTFADTAEAVHESLAPASGGLPKGVPDRGKGFAAELMEASRKLGALARSRVTLRPGVRGQYVKTLNRDRIEAGDIHNQNTVAHEIGHHLDATLFPNQFPLKTQASLVARVGTGTAKELHAELVKVSELMRGKMTGTKGRVAYRKSAQELVADFFSLYAHDADQARALAPKFTRGFEAALKTVPEADAVVQELLAGKVTPIAPARVDTETVKPVALAGKVPARVVGDATRERQAATAAEGLVKGSVRTFAAQKEAARIVGDNWKKSVPDQSQRNDVGAFIEGIGNLEKKGDTIDAVKARMTEPMLQFAKDYRFKIELQRQKINEYLKDTNDGEYLAFLEDYLGHFYADGKTKIQSSLGRFLKQSPHAKQRKIPTLKEAVDLGLTPITQDPATTYEISSRINWQVATNRKFVASMRDIKLTSGEPGVLPAKDALPGWVITNNPLIQQVYARQVPNGVVIWQGGAAIHPDIWRAARMILDTPTSSDLGRAYDALNGVTRANAFAFSFFHDLNLRAAAAGVHALSSSPMRGLVSFMERNPVTGELNLIRPTRARGKELLQSEEAVMDAAQHGLKFSYADSDSYQKSARDFLEKIAARTRTVPLLGKATRIARDLQQMRQENLWKNTHDAYKIVTYHDLVSKALQSAPAGTDVALAKERIASLLNDAFGGQEWQTKFWMSPQMRQGLSRFFLAPDWTLSTIRSVPFVSDVASAAREHAPRLAGREPFPTGERWQGGNLKRARFWGGELAALATATIFAQYAIYSAFGDKKKGDKPFVDDNEISNRYTVDVTPIIRKMPWHDPNDQTRHYVNLGKRAMEIVRWFSDPAANIESKSSRAIAEVFKQVSGMDGEFKAAWKRDHETFSESIPSRFASVGKEFFPFSFTGQQFALSVPMRKGMTRYKAEQALESVFELEAEPNRFKSYLRGQSPDTNSMVQQISDAAKANGVKDFDKIKARAESSIRGRYYHEWLKALAAGKIEDAHKFSVILERLHATEKGRDRAQALYEASH